MMFTHDTSSLIPQHQYCGKVIFIRHPIIIISAQDISYMPKHFIKTCLTVTIHFYLKTLFLILTHIYQRGQMGEKRYSWEHIISLCQRLQLVTTSRWQYKARLSYRFIGIHILFLPPNFLTEILPSLYPSLQHGGWRQKVYFNPSILWQIVIVGC